MTCEVLKWWCASFLLLGRRQSRKSLWTNIVVCIQQKTCLFLFLQINFNIRFCFTEVRLPGTVVKHLEKRNGVSYGLHHTSQQRSFGKKDFKSKAKPSVATSFFGSVTRLLWFLAHSSLQGQQPQPTLTCSEENQPGPCRQSARTPCCAHVWDVSGQECACLWD